MKISINNFKNINENALSEINGGIAPLLIAGGMILAGGGSFVAGYGLSRWLG
ncbi:class IIb bacteriocin, lactobin A/cerein 7B family [Apilactobacillus bombintestini]|uniref:Class IIb bacteriocin, lactobin A/cerein 7B family n=1 Tax=Apilactobacillus bombintestini TaxID=2419772 RepID=A0A387ATD6_9LACO|nr:class IIb bacteriocin, lactobin A/cerein 7B family [Apilactobacillus bombintestini]AYF91986.1 class IIb bacteriocin, lactobin A/cerein 7B family [Apilactobacillus bombintestini]